jgi:4-cresol dehydrogenase (hydroxylating)
VEALRPLLLDGTIQSNAMIGNAAIIASMISERALWADGDAPLSDAALDRMAKGLGLGRWNARFGVYGDTAMVAARLARIRSALAQVDGVELVVREYDGDVPPEQVHPADRAQLGVPSTELVRMGAWRARQPAHTDFSLVCAPIGADAVEAMRMIRAEVERCGFDYAGGFTLFPRHAIALSLVAFDRENASQCESVATLMHTLIAMSRDRGQAPYRSHVAFMDDIARSYGDGGLAGLKDLLKDALDPLGVLSPGKQGVWPGRSRLAQ